MIGTFFLLVKITIYFGLAWCVQRLSWRIAGAILALHSEIMPALFQGRLGPLTRLPWASRKWSEFLPDELKAPIELRQARQRTLHELIASAVSFLAFLMAGVATLREFTNPDTVVWVSGLVVSAMILAAGTPIRDALAGIEIIFNDQFVVGEKLLIKAQFEKFEGVVEHVSLGRTWLRAPTGELYIIPNGELRFICNYSRGLHSSAKITIKIPATYLDRALPVLRGLGQEAVSLLPALLEPWQVISETGVMGENAELTLVVRTQFGHGAELRPHLLALVQKRLAMADIPLAG